MKLIVIDPGHGGRDPGAVGHNLKEKNLNMQLAELVANDAASYPFKILLTREGDTTLGLSERVKMANRSAADFFLSLHVNAGGGEGFESYIHTRHSPQGEAARLQSLIHEHVMGKLAGYNIRDRGRKRANFFVLRETKMPALLLESLFIDNSREAKLWQTKTFRSILAKGIVAGIAEAFGYNRLYTVQVGAFRHRQNAEKQLQKVRGKGFSDAFIQVK